MAVYVRVNMDTVIDTFLRTHKLLPVFTVITYVIEFSIKRPNLSSDSS